MRPRRRKRTGWRQGYYKPLNPEKYVGNKSAIRYMSSWELNVHGFLDKHPAVLKWNSEGLRIPYIKPTDGRVHYYLPDYWVKFKTKGGNIVQEIWEVKPSKYQKPSRAKNARQKIYENAQYLVNTAKWKAAKKYATDRGISFKIKTEKDIFK